MLIRNKYIIEAIALLSYILFAMAWLGGTANMAEIMEAMGVTSLAAGSMLSGAMTTAKIVGAFIAAGVALKFGIKAAFFASAAMVGVGIVTPYSPNYEVLLISRFIMGLGGALMVVYFNPIVLKFFEPKERPTVNGINAVSFNIGATIALWFMADLNALLGGWQNTLIAFGIISLALGFAWLLVDYSDDPKAESKAGSDGETNEETQNYGYKEGLSDSFNWRYALTYAGILAFYLSLLTFSTSAGIEATKYVMGSGILGSLAGMACCQYFPKRLPVLRWSGLCITIAAIGLLFSDSSSVQTISGVAIGFFMFMAVPALVTIPHELPKMTGQRVTVIFSMFWSVSYLFSTIVLWAFGQLVDISGNYQSAFILVTVLSSSFFIGSFFLGEAAPSTEAEDDSLTCAETS